MILFLIVLKSTDLELSAFEELSASGQSVGGTRVWIAQGSSHTCGLVWAGGPRLSREKG